MLSKVFFPFFIFFDKSTLKVDRESFDFEPHIAIFHSCYFSFGGIVLKTTSHNGEDTPKANSGYL